VAEQFDIVVAGAGHNSLLAAAYLAKAGFRCMVLEGRPIAGGGVKSAELTLRGFIHDVCSSAHNGIHGNPVLRNDELKLGDYGLEYIFPDPVFHMPFPDGSYLTQWRDLDRTCEEFAKFSIPSGSGSLSTSALRNIRKENCGNGGWPCLRGKFCATPSKTIIAALS
jgi:phytoene dehydrogenase-like protein